MLEALTYSSFLQSIHNSDIKSDTIGILFTRPELDTGRSIVHSLPYYHHMSSENINFFLPGYSAYMEKPYEDSKLVIVIDGVKWTYCVSCFVQFVKDIEKYSKWNYSGESDLLLVDYADNKIRYDRTIDFKLDSMIRDGIISSVPSFFQDLFRYSKNHSIYSISNRGKINGGTQISIELIKQYLPSILGRGLDFVKYYSVEGLSR